MVLITGTEFDIRQNDAGSIKITTDVTADDGDTIDVDLSTYGASGIDSIIGFIHSTTDSILVQEQPTTAVVAGTLTITVGGAVDNKKRTYLVGLAN